MTNPKRVVAFFSALLVMVVIALSVPTQSYGTGKFIEADVVGYMQVDPILNHNIPMSAHGHLFLGSTKLLQLEHPESAEYNDLVGNGTLLDNPDDTAAYWVPDLVYVSSGQSVEFKKYFAYYRGWNHQAQSTDTGVFPPDLRVVTGDAKGIDTGPINKNNWSCDDRSDRPGPYRTIEEARCDLATGTVFLTLHVTFPSCWDGQLNDHNKTGDTTDSNHVRYPVNANKCPVGFPYKMPELRETIKWDYQGDGSDVALTSDLMQRHMGNPVQSGQTLHADFWNTWVQTGGVHNGLTGMVDSCIKVYNPANWCNE